METNEKKEFINDNIVYKKNSLYFRDHLLGGSYSHIFRKYAYTR